MSPQRRHRPHCENSSNAADTVASAQRGFVSLVKECEEARSGGERIIIQAIARSLTNKFPHVKVLKSVDSSGYHFIASMQTIRYPDPLTIFQKMHVSAWQDYLEWHESKDLNVITLRLSMMPEREIPLHEFLHEDEEIFISDEHPFNEYYLMRRLVKKARSGI